MSTLWLWLAGGLAVYFAGVIITGRVMYRRIIPRELMVHRRAVAREEALRQMWSPAVFWPVFWLFIGVQQLWAWNNEPDEEGTPRP